MIIKPDFDSSRTKGSSRHVVPKKTISGKSNIAKLLTGFFTRTMKNAEDIKDKKDIQFDEDASYEHLLIEEILKPKNDVFGIYRIKLRKKFEHTENAAKNFWKRNNTKSTEVNSRNIKKIVYLLKQLKGFKKYTKFNSIDDINISNLAHYIEYKFVPKGSYIFKQDDQSDKFWGVIKGRISIRTKKFLTLNTLRNHAIKDTVDSPTDYKKDQDNISFTTEKFISPIYSPIKQPISNLKQVVPELSFNTPKKQPSFKLDTSPPKIVLDDRNITNEMRFELEEENLQLTEGMCFGEWGLLYNKVRGASAYTLEDTHLFYIDKEAFEYTLSKSIHKGDNEKRSFLFRRFPDIKEGKDHNILSKIVPMFYDSGDIIYTELDEAKDVYLVYDGECRITKFFTEGKGPTIKSPKTIDDIFKNKNKLVTFLKLAKGGIAGLEASNKSKTYKYNLVCSRDCTILFKIRCEILEKMSDELVVYLKILREKQQKSLEDFKIAYIKGNEMTLIEKITKSLNEEKLEKLDKLSIKQAPQGNNKIPIKTQYINKEKIKIIKERKLKGIEEKLNLEKGKLRAAILSPTNMLDKLLSKSGQSLVKRKESRIIDTKSFYLTALKKRVHSKEGSFSTESVYSNYYNNTEATTKFNSSKFNNRSDSFYPVRIIKESEKYFEEIEDPKIKKYSSHKTVAVLKMKNMSYDLNINKSIRQVINIWNDANEENSHYYDTGTFNLPLLTMGK